jgi:hypothetical protein
VSGPKGEATLHARAGRGSGPWVFSALELLQGDRSVANLLEPDDPAAQVQLEPHQRPYLVRLGPPRSVSIDELPGYYRTRLGLAVETLPTLPLEAGTFDPRRGQHIAEELIAVMKRRLPGWPATPPPSSSGSPRRPCTSAPTTGASPSTIAATSASR